MIDGSRNETVLPSSTKRVSMDCGNLYVTIDGIKRARRVDAQLGHAGCCERSFLGGICILINMLLDEGMSLSHIGKNLSGIACPRGQAGDPSTRALSCVDAIAKVLQNDS